MPPILDYKNPEVSEKCHWFSTENPLCGAFFISVSFSIKWDQWEQYRFNYVEQKEERSLSADMAVTVGYNVVLGMLQFREMMNKDQKV